MKKYLLLSLFFLANVSFTFSQQTVGLFLNDSANSFNGYTLFAPMRYTTTYLINNNGKLVHSWESSYAPGLSAYLLPNGHLFRTANNTSVTSFNTGGKGGKIEEYDWDGNVVWQFDYASSSVMQHHDVKKLLNGNVLVIAWELKTQAEVLAEGRNPTYVSSSGLWPDHIIEVDSASGNIIWEWHVWDHLIQDYDNTKENFGVVADHPELIDVNFVKQGNPTNTDWTHINSIDYDSVFDQILLSVHGFNEIWIIDHSTTTAEASGHSGGNSGKGGDLLYRWGNPRAYDLGTVNDQKLFGQHNASWIEDGLIGARNILIFNNGQNRTGGNYSSVDEIVPPIDVNGFYSRTANSAFGPTATIRSYSNGTSFYASNISGAHRLPNGNTFICDGPSGEFFEVTQANQTVWKYINPVSASGPMTQGDSIPTSTQGAQENTSFRAYRYAPSYSAFTGRDLTPGNTIEIYPTTSDTGISPVIYSWKLNLTGQTGYNGISANVQQVRYSTNYVYVNCTDVPDYSIGPWPGNPNDVTNQNFVFKIKRNPIQNTGTQTATALGHIGVFVNGVSIYNAKDAFSYNNLGIWNQNAVIVEASSFDACYGHPPQSGEYHHHQNPHCLYDAIPNEHSPLLGFAFDGFPIYGPYAYANTNGTGAISRMKSSYRKRSISQRRTLADGTVLPSNQYGPDVTTQYPLGYYLEDFEYVSNLGHLDAHNGRFAVTPEYPNGTYAYYVTIDSLGASEYPYIIGPKYYGILETVNVGPGSGHATISESVTNYTGQFSITATAGTGGTISPSGNVTVNFNESKTFTVSTNAGYYVDSIFVDGNYVGTYPSYTFTNVAMNHTISVLFKPFTFTISVTQGSNGTISPSTSTVNYGTNKTFSIHGNTGYHVDSVLVDGNYVESDTSYTFTNVTTNHTITALFAINTYTISASSGNNGTISNEGNNVVEYGDTLSFTFTPSTGFHVDSVFVDETFAGTGSSYTFTNISSNHAISVSFVINTFTITATSDTNGTISPLGISGVDYGDTLSLLFTPNTGFHIQDVFLDGETSLGNINAYTFYDITENHTISVSFAINTYIVSATAGDNGTISPSGNVNANYGTSQTFSISPANLYHVDSVFVDDVFVDSTTSYSFANITANHTIHVTFAMNDTTKYRTFKNEIALSAKPNKLKVKSTQPAALPNIANFRDTVISRYGGKNGIVLGIVETSKDSLKKYGWIRFKKGTDFGKFYSAIQSDTTFNAPFDTVRKSGSNKKKKFLKELKPTSASYTNPLAQAFGVFKLNLYASKKSITPSGFDSLTFVEDGNMWNGKTLSQIANEVDTLLSKYPWKKLPNGNSAIVGSTELEQLRKMLSEINEAFYNSISLSNGDSIVASQGLKFPGVISLYTFPKLQRLPNVKVEELNSSFLSIEEFAKGFSLEQNYPNPFNPVTIIRYQLSVNSVVTMRVYDILGKEVATLLNNEAMEEGEYEIEFDAFSFPSGLYFYRLTTNNFSQTKKMMLTK
ncbi:MAG: YHYH protein [Ignavibacteriales bacterium]|nr:YHYH protein [Ignavibacteriales bacterium]